MKATTVFNSNLKPPWLELCLGPKALISVPAVDNVDEEESDLNLLPSWPHQDHEMLSEFLARSKYNSISNII